MVKVKASTQRAKRRFKKRTSTKRQRGSGYPIPLNRNVKGRRLQEKLKKDLYIPKYNVNDGIYTNYKYTILKQGAEFQFRSTYPMQKGMIERRPMWLEYRRSNDEPSFLLGQDIPYGMWGCMLVRFGSYINTIRILKPMKILHFPVFYDSPEDMNSIDAIYEGYVREMCITKKYEVCADGYTLDFMFKPDETCPPFRSYTPIQGRRELCILRPVEGENIEFVSSEFNSLGPVPPSWPPPSSAPIK